MQEIKNNILKVSVQKTGAELCSIVSLKSGKEFIWQADPEIWGSSAPVLFPIIGSLRNGEFLYKGKAYSVPKHCFIRNKKNLIVNQIYD